MILLDMIKEYLLIAYIRLLPYLKNNIPEEWNHGNKGTILLVPGFQESSFCFYSLGNRLNKYGYRILTIPDFNSIERIRDISDKIDKLLRSTDASDIILVSHSKGGIVAKYFLDNSSQSHRINYSISLATPYLGSIFAKLQYHNIWELVPGSELLKQINLNDAHIAKIINLYPKFDNHVIPSKNLLLKGAKNIQINVNGHTRILVCEETYTEIIKALANN